MAKKQLNRKLMVALLLIGLPLLAIVMIAVDYKYPFLPEIVHKMMGNDPVKLEAGARAKIEIVEQKERELLASVGAIADPQAKYEAILKFYEKDWAPQWRDIFKMIDQALKYSHDGEIDQNLRIWKADLLVRVHNPALAVKTWTGITQRYPDNNTARRAIVEYSYRRCQHWPKPDVWLDLNKQAGQLAQSDPANPYGYLVQAHCQITLLSMKATENPAETRNQAVAALDKAGTLDANHPLLWKLRGLLAMLDSLNAANPEERNLAVNRAETAFREAVSRNPEDAEACYTLLNDYYVTRTDQIRAELNRLSDAATGSGETELDLWSKQVLAEIDAALARFPGTAKLYALKAEFLIDRIRAYDDFGPAIDLYQQALRLEESNLLWRVAIGQLYLTRAEWSADPGADFLLAWDNLRTGYYRSLWPDRDSIGAITWPGIRAGLALPSLVETSLDLHRLTGDAALQQRYLEAANTFARALKDAVSELHPTYRAATALIDMAGNNRDGGIRTLLKVCQEIEQTEGLANNRKLQRYYYRLALNLAKNGQTTIATSMARKSDLARRGGFAYKNLFDALIGVEGATNQAILLSFISEYYEKFHSPSDPYYQEMMTFKARLLLATPSRREEARTLIASLSGENKNLDLLRAQILDDEAAREAAYARLAERYPGDGEIVQTLANYYFGKTDYSKAAVYIQQGLTAEPDNLSLRIKALTLKAPDPANLTTDQQKDIFLQAVQSLSDPKEKARQTAIFYRNRAAELSGGNLELTGEARQLWQAADQASQQLEQLDGDSLDACEGQFYAALSQGDLKRADTLAAQLERRDAYNGLRLRADYLMGQKDWNNARVSLEKAIDLNPAALDCRFNAATTCLNLDLPAEAEKHLRNLLQLDPFHARGNLMLAILLERQYGAAQLTRPQIQEIMLLARHILDVQPTHLTGNLIYITYIDRFIQTLHNDAQSPLVNDKTKELYRQSILEYHQEIVKRGLFLVNTAPTNDQNWHALLLHYINYAKLADSGQDSLIQETGQLFQKAFEQVPDSTRIIALFEQYQADRGQTGQGEKLLLDLIARSKGETKHQAMFNLAQLYTKNQQNDRAIALMEQLLAETPDSIEGARQLGTLYLNDGDFARAVATYEKASQASDDPLPLIGLVDALLASRDIDRAAATIALLEGSPKYQGTRAGYQKEVLLQKTRIALSQVQYDQALTFADAVLKLDARQPLALRFKCEALYNANRLDEAETAARDMMTAAPGQADTARLILARINRQRGLTAQAINLLRDTLAANPGHGPSQLLFIQILEQDKRWSDLEAYYSSLLNRSPQRIDYQVAMGKFFLERALAEEERARAGGNPTLVEEAQTLARTHFRRATDTLSKAYQASANNPQNLALVYDVFINMLISTSNFKDALAILDNTLSANPDDIKSHLYRIEALARSGQPAQALVQVQTLLDTPDLNETSRILLLNQIGKAGDPPTILEWARPLAGQQPNRPDYHWILAIAAAYQGDYGQELVHWQNALSHATDTMRMEILSRLGNACMLTAEYQKGYDIYHQLMTSLPDAQGNPEVLNNLAYALLNLGHDPQEAVRLARQAYYLRSNAHPIADTYALALIQTGDFKTARLLLAQVVRDADAAGQSTPVEYRYHLALALQGEGNRDGALQQVQAAQGLLDTLRGETARTGWQQKLGRLHDQLTQQ